MAFSMPGFNCHIFLWFGLSLFLFSLEPESGISQKRRFLKNVFRGLFFGLLFFGISMFWFIPTFTQYIPEVIRSFPAFMGIIVFFLLIFVESLFYALFAGIYTIVYQKIISKGLLFCLFTGFLLFITEWLRAAGPMGFTGYRFSDGIVNLNGLLQFVSVTGTEGVNIFIGIVNALFFYLIRFTGVQNNLRKCFTLIAVIVLCLYSTDSFIQASFPPIYSEGTEIVGIGAMQTMVSSEEKYRFSEAEFLTDFEQSLELAKNEELPFDFIAFPEAYFMYDILNRPRTNQRLSLIAKQENMVYVLPHLAEMEDGKYYNAVRIVEPLKGVSETFYGKMHLNPFVETLPFEKIFGIFGFIKFSNYFTPGTVAHSFEINGRKYAFPICFESYYPEVFNTFVREGAEAFVVLTNDVWFSIPVALEQHFAQIRFRAVESRKWVSQVSNNGITGVSDPYGRVTSRISAFDRKFEPLLMGFRKEGYLYSFLNHREIVLWIYGAFFFILLFYAYIRKPVHRREEKKEDVEKTV
jgi:apolipoprotein N-acyltransferase